MRRIIRPLLHFSKSSRLLHHQTDPSNVGHMASLLKSRSVVRFSGPDTIKFLQGLLTNDVRKFGAPAGEREKLSSQPTPNLPYESASPVYAALLTPQGRFLYDFFLYSPPKPEEKLERSGSGPGSSPKDEVEEVFADVDASFLDELLQTLKKYRLRAKVDIENVAADFSCWQRYGGKNLSSVEEPEAGSIGWGSGVDRSGVSASQGSDVGWQWFKDPRLDCLGSRGIFRAGKTPPSVEADSETVEENYLSWRLELGVAEGSSEIPKGEAMPLEYNFAGLNAISFDKGCYVGQELIARTHHRGVIRKRLLPVKFLDSAGKDVEQKVAPGSEVIDSQSGKKAGKVSTALGSRGMGVLRLEHAFSESANLTIEGHEHVKVQAIKPHWWSAEWFREHQQQAAGV